MPFPKNAYINDELHRCVIMDKSTKPDGYGGILTTWTEGAEFDAAISTMTSTEAVIAMAQGLDNRYTIITEDTVVLQPFDVFKRVSDGRYFEVTNDGRDRTTPKRSQLKLRAVDAKEVHI